ncbi:response regulator [Erythrobacter sp.]|uniref:response regulator n=1 Tax=Erythrobacter sp. TaxID=1042 RepID=UPI0025F8FB17|nr:response regulator [Erythrobacter sp.]
MAERHGAPPAKWSGVVSHALIIEDDFWLAVEMKEALGELGYATFDLATRMRQAIAYAEQQCPDLIIADHMIVGGTGAEAIATICSDVPVPVVFVTSSRSQVQQRLPAVPVVDKPWTTATLHEAINQAIERPFRTG